MSENTVNPSAGERRAVRELSRALAATLEAYEAALGRLCELGQGFGTAGSQTVIPGAREALRKHAPAEYGTLVHRTVLREG